MTVLQVADLRFGYAGDTLFEGVTFKLGIGDRAALVAPNGAGKSTLLRLIGHELEPDGGSAIIKRDVTVGYYRQSHEVAAHGDVLAAFLSGFNDIVEARAALATAQQDAATGGAEALERLAHATERYHVAGGDALEHKVAAIAAKLGFSDADLVRPVASLSGGERGRLHLGVVLAQQPDLLLLDEPTNHLDILSIRWLETFLLDYQGCALVISHDQRFLEAIATHILDVDYGTVELYTGGYKLFAIEKKLTRERKEAEIARIQKIIADKRAFVDRFGAKASKAKQAQSRLKQI